MAVLPYGVALGHVEPWVHDAVELVSSPDARSTYQLSAAETGQKMELVRQIRISSVAN